MVGSLQDQLLGAGLIDKKKAKKISAQKRKQEKKNRKLKREVIDESAEMAEKAIADEKEHSRLLNEEKNQMAEKKAAMAQIKQLVEINKIDLRVNAKEGDGLANKGEIAYHFADADKVKVLYVNEKVQNALSSGQLAIVRIEDSYQVVPQAVAQKIKIRDPSIVIQINPVTKEKSSENDPYAEYEIPDDLMW